MKTLKLLTGIIVTALFFSCQDSSSETNPESEPIQLSSSYLSVSSSSQPVVSADFGIGVWRASVEGRLLSFIVHRTEKGLQIQYQEEDDYDTLDYMTIAFHLVQKPDGYEFDLDGESLEHFQIVLDEATNSGTFKGGYYQSGVLVRVSEPKLCNSECAMGVCDMVNGLCNTCEEAESCTIKCINDVDCTGAFGGTKCNAVTGYCQKRCDEDEYGCMWGTECMADGFCSYEAQYTTDRLN